MNRIKKEMQLSIHKINSTQRSGWISFAIVKWKNNSFYKNRLALGSCISVSPVPTALPMGKCCAQSSSTLYAPPHSSCTGQGAGD